MHTNYASFSSKDWFQNSTFWLGMWKYNKGYLSRHWKTGTLLFWPFSDTWLYRFLLSAKCSVIKLLSKKKYLQYLAHLFSYESSNITVLIPIELQYDRKTGKSHKQFGNKFRPVSIRKVLRPPKEPSMKPLIDKPLILQTAMISRLVKNTTTWERNNPIGRKFSSSVYFRQTVLGNLLPYNMWS